MVRKEGRLLDPHVQRQRPVPPGVFLLPQRVQHLQEQPVQHTGRTTAEEHLTHFEAIEVSALSICGERWENVI